MPFPVAAAIAAGASLAGQAAQTAGTAARNRKQYFIQKKLMDYSQQKNESMALFNNRLQMEMWENTGPVGQMEQLKKAQLNPGLIYGMGGAGGQTANAAQAQGVGTPSADVENTTQGMGITGQIVGEQLALLKAQKENIQADTAKKTAETAYTGGAQTQNTQANTALTNVNTKIAELNRQLADGTLEQNIANVSNEATRIWNEARSSIAKANVDQATQETQIKQVQADLTQTLAATALINAQKHLAESNIHLNNETIQNWAQNNKMRFMEILNNQDNRSIEQQQQQMNGLLEQLNLPANTMKELGQNILHAIMLGGILKYTPEEPKREPIKGFQSKY